MENQFRIGGCYKQKHCDDIIRLEPSDEPGFAVGVAIFRDGTTYECVTPFNLATGIWGRDEDDDKGRLIPGELHNVGGEWVEKRDFGAITVGCDHMAVGYESKPRDFGAIKPLDSKPDADGWIEWKGGECPVHPDTKVRYRMRDGELSVSEGGEIAQWLRWVHASRRSDIIAYRVIEPAKAEGEKIAEPEASLEDVMDVIADMHAADARMIARDGEAKPKAIQPAPEPVSTAKPAIQGLTIERPLTGLVSPGFGSALLG